MLARTQGLQRQKGRSTGTGKGLDRQETMALSDTVRHQADLLMTAYCERRVPPHVRDKVRMHHEVQGDSVTLFEDRPHLNKPGEWTHVPIAQFRFDQKSGRWGLYCADRNTQWQFYRKVKRSSDLELLLKAVDADVTGIFFG